MRYKPFGITSLAISIIRADASHPTPAMQRYIFANGDIYDGDFQRDQAWGRGIYRTAVSGNRAGDCYVGGWEADRRHGKGTLRWANGSRYEVRWANGSRRVVRWASSGFTDVR